MNINCTRCSKLFFHLFLLISFFIFSCDHQPERKQGSILSPGKPESSGEVIAADEYQPIYALLVSPESPRPGEAFRIVVTGGKNILKANIIITGPAGDLLTSGFKTGGGIPFWRVENFNAAPEGKYKVALFIDKKETISREFQIKSETRRTAPGVVWNSRLGWDSGMEELYSAWINALFDGCGEDASWPSLTRVIQNQQQNFLYNHLSLDEDDPNGKNRVIMQPDCADNPFFLRAYFAWKLGLPFGYHVCDRGSLARNPRTGQWITNETSSSKTNPVLAFNSFLRRDDGWCPFRYSPDCTG